jgi:hypothetical protein
MHSVLVCAPSQATQLPCPNGMAIQAVDAYLIDPDVAASISAQNAPFDYAAASAIWGVAFTFVVALFLVSKSAGTVLQRIRR